MQSKRNKSVCWLSEERMFCFELCVHGLVRRGLEGIGCACPGVCLLIRYGCAFCFF